jgi:glycosyltransferase involved in cell wall biosynthesis
VPSETLIIVPALNEERRIGAVVGGIRRCAPGASVLVIDDGSRDATAAEARAAGARVVSHPFNLGYGAALQTGYRYALRGGFARAVQMDADGQHEPESIASLIAALDAGADLVLGSRFLEPGSYRPTAARRLGMRLFGALAALALRRPVSDATTGYQGLSRRLLAFYDRPGAFPHDYPDANMIVRVARAGLRIAEVPVRMRENPTGGSLHVGLRPVVYVVKMLFAVGVEMSRRVKAPEG